MSRARLLAPFACALLALSFASTVDAQDLGVQVELGGVGHEMVYDADREQLHVTVPSLNEVVSVSTRSLEVVNRIVVGSRPRGIDLSHDGTRLFVALGEAGAVAVVDLASESVEEIVLGTELEDSRTWDVLEAQPERLFVTANPGSSGFARVVQVRLDRGDETRRVADGRIIRARPELAASPDGRFLYVGEGFSPNSLYKLDLGEEDAPIVLEDDHGDVSGTDDLTVSPDGTRVHTTSGQVLRAGSFVQAGRVSAGLARYGDDPAVFHVAEYPGFGDSETSVRVATFRRGTFVEERARMLPCPSERFDGFTDFFVLPEEGGFLLLNQDTVCGVVGDGLGLDADDDGVADSSDNCPNVSNANQENRDGDELGDACDPFPDRADNLAACLDASADDEARIDELEQEVSDLEASLAEAEAEADELREELESLQQESDTDGDGVADARDRCPGSSPFFRVDARGCHPWERPSPFAGGGFGFLLWWLFGGLSL